MPEDYQHALGGMYRLHRQHNIDLWTTFFRQCWRKALGYQEFEEEARKIFAQASLNALDLFQAWSNQIRVQKAVSARMLRYLDILQRLRLIREVTVLEAIMRNLSALFDKATDPNARPGGIAEIGALSRMTTNTLFNIQSKTAKRPAPDVQISMRLFKLIGLFSGTAVARGGLITGVVLALGEAIASFLVAHVNDLHATNVLTLDNGKAPASLKRAFSKVVPTFIEVLSASGSQLAPSLTLLQQQSKLQEGMGDQIDEVVASNVDAMAFAQGTQSDTSITPTRASLYAYLTAALTATPRLDDLELQIFLTARHHDDIRAMAIDLITASFDVLAGAMERKEHMEVIIMHKSFITNKVPSLIEQFNQQSNLEADSSSLGECVTTAIKRVHESYQGTSVFQPGSDACPKQRFLLSCALFGFIHMSAVPTLLGYPPTQGLPATGRYDKNKLVQECQADSKRIEQLVGELNQMEGNAAAIARALLEILHTLCANRDTMTLRMLCVAFLRRPHHINVMLLFTNPRYLLQPLCHLLDQWQSHDDQGEQTIAYDEFGSTLLFVMMCQYRYDLPLSSFTMVSPESFLTEFVQSGTLAKQFKELTETERKHLNGWVKGLFEKDGISDELLSACPPKEFYRLAATLIDQIMNATQTGVLGIETAKTGAEYLLEPFLLPSLVVVFPVFAARLASMAPESPQIDFLMPILLKLVKPPNLSSDASPLHQAALFISARPLWQTLLTIKNVQKSRRDVGPMLEAVKNDRLKPFSLGVTRTLLEEWCTEKRQESTGNHSGISVTFQNSLENLSKWNHPGKTVPDRQAYNHRLTVLAVNTLGTTRALDLLLDQASKAATNPKSTDQIVDTLTGLIAASSLTSTSGADTLRDALNHAHNEAQPHPSTRESVGRSTLIARLHRRVQDHCTKPIGQPPPIIPLTVDAAMPNATGQVGVGVGVDVTALDAATAAAAVAGVDLKDIPMQDASDLMAGLEAAAKGGDGLLSQQPGAQQGQGMPMNGNDMVNMGNMDDMQDLGEFQEFLQDMDISRTQNFEDFF